MCSNDVMMCRQDFRARGQKSLPFLLLIATIVASACGTARAQEAEVALQPCKNHYSPEKQIEIGQKAAAQVYKEMPVLPDSSPVTQYVQALGEKLVAYAPGYRWPYNFHVVNVADINAFALPGGSIFVNLGTIQAADDEAQLAAVMAHEMSHVVLQHSVCNLEKEKRVGLLAGIGQIAAGIALGGALGTVAEEGIGLGAGLGFLKMSRGDEKQADMEGASILYNAGYDPRAMPQFFETIEAKYGKGGAQFLSDHPNPGNRTDYIDKEIARFPRREHPTTNTPEFERIHKMVAGMRAYTAKEVASGVWKKKGPNETVETGINDYDVQTAQTGNVDLSPPQSWNTFQGDGFTMEVPSNWGLLGNQSNAMIAPEGGIAKAPDGKLGNLVYGVLTDVYTPPEGTPRKQEFTALLKELNSENAGMQPGSTTKLRVAGQRAESAESVSPQANGGRGEHDWIVGIPAETSMRYFVFVCPEPDFKTMQPTFEHMLKSIQVR
jgi:Zn-dependent protease with chaperone function